MPVAGAFDGYPGYYNWRWLLANADELTPDDPARWQNRSLLRIRDKKVSLSGANHGDVRFPQELEGLEPLRELLGQIASLVGEDCAQDAATSLLLRPRRIFELSDEVTNALQVRELAFTSAVARHGVRFLLIARLTLMRNLVSRVTTLETARLQWSSEDEDVLNWTAETLYLETNPTMHQAANAPPVPIRTLWLGGSRAEVSDMPLHWRTEIEAVGQARGHTFEVIERPSTYRSVVKKRIETTAPAAVVCWTPYSGGLGSSLAWPAETLVLTLDEPLYSEMLIEARMTLDSTLRELSAPAEAKVRSPSDWREAVAWLGDLESDALVLSSDCRRTLADCPYRDVSRMWEHLLNLRHAADKWRAGGGKVDEALHKWIWTHYGIEVALHDANLGRSADFEFEGQDLRCEPHVKVDDGKSADLCGRIYFAIDNDKLRFVVHHIGLHL